MGCREMQTDDGPVRARPFRVRSAGDLGLAVQHYRTQAGLTQAELAARAGLHRSYLAALENGHVTEATVRIMSLLSELGVRVSLTREDA